MKQFFTLCALLLAATFAKSQVVLNEVYPEPGNTFQEYFELYNTSTSSTPENLDNYTVVIYYEEPGGKSGFYVFDLPAATLGPKDYFVVSSQTTFSIQGQSNLTADLNWNSLTGDASITKWEKSGTSYVQVPVSFPLTDLFVRNTGNSSGPYSVFVFENGMQVNGLVIASTGVGLPSNIKAMPNLPVDMSGSSPDFTISFNTMADNSVESVNSNAGTDNGYYRQYDGKCGVWVKSASGADYTPGSSNGSAADAVGTLTISSFISSNVLNPYQALLTYNVTAGPAEAFAVVIQVYRDLGIAGELDANDVLLDTKNIANASVGSQQVILPSITDGVILVAKSPAGCFDRVIALSTPFSTLPVHLMSFQGNMDKNNKVTLNWTVADNETVNNFEIQRSTNGKDFSTVAIVFGTEKVGTEKYMYYETNNSNDKVMYRLKMTDKGNDADYSKILVFQSKSTASKDIKIIGNPVTDKLTFSFSSNRTQVVDVKIYEVTGKMIMKHKVNSFEGNNTMSLPLNSNLKPGMYIVEVSDGSDYQVSKFVKR